MVEIGPYVAESHILIDYDNSVWGYRGFDFNYFFVQVSTTQAQKTMLVKRLKNISSSLTFQKMMNC